MDIQNDTNEPVDYDIDTGGGGGGAVAYVADAGTEDTTNGPPAFVCPMEPKFRLGPKGNPNAKVSFDLSQQTRDHRLIFLITPTSGQQTMLVVPSVPPGTSTVKVETSGAGFYRAVLS